MAVVSIRADVRLGVGYPPNRKRTWSCCNCVHRRYLLRLDPLPGWTRFTCPSSHSIHWVRALEDAATGAPEEESVQMGGEVHQVGDVVDGRYRVEAILGKGGNAVTMRCARLSDEKMVAVKFLSLRTAGSWKQIELFEREAQVLQQLSHPNIPSYMDSFEIDTKTDKRFYIVQELADGVSLAKLVENGSRFSEDEVERIATELLGVLRYLSRMQPPVIHRDIKPENIILHEGIAGGRVYLVDFGGVQGVNLEMPSGSTIIGTYGYMAPEQFRGMAEVKSDLYGLGATLLYLVSGRRPTSFAQERLKIDFVDSISTSPVLISLLDALLEPLPEDRIDVEDAMAILANESEIEPMSKLSQRTWRPRKRSKPIGSRSKIRRTGSTGLEIDIPAAGLGGANLASGTFALAWNAFVLFWSYSALMSGGIVPLLFSIPFWYAGAEITKLSISNCLMHQNLRINARHFYLTKELSFLREEDDVDDIGKLTDEKTAKKQIKGKTRDIAKPKIATSAIVNGVPQTCIEFSEGVRTHVFGEGLTRIEQEWLLDEMIDTLRNISNDMSFY